MKLAEPLLTEFHLQIENVFKNNYSLKVCTKKYQLDKKPLGLVANHSQNYEVPLYDNSDNSDDSNDSDDCDNSHASDNCDGSDDSDNSDNSGNSNDSDDSDNSNNCLDSDDSNNVTYMYLITYAALQLCNRIGFPDFTISQ